MSAVPLATLDLGDHDVRGVLDGERGLRGYECRDCGRFHRSPESFEVEGCRA
jgi:hypothetical protein